MAKTIAIIDFGSGNLRSATKAFEHMVAETGSRHEVVLTDRADDVARAERIVLPGQGAFGDCMRSLKALDGMVETLQDKVLQEGVPFFGICVGMQLLATRGLEYGETQGLGWVPGEVVAIPSAPALKIPHMGWNDLINAVPHPVLRSIKSNEEISRHFYFVHSFMFNCTDKGHKLASVDYGQEITAIVGRDNIIGTQFHPEKSQAAGLAMIKDFLKWMP